MDEVFPWDQPKPKPPQQQPQAPTSTNGLLWLVIGLVIGVLVWDLLNKGDLPFPGPQPDPYGGKDDEQKDKDDDQRVKPNLNGGAVLVVDESSNRTADQQIVLNDWNFFNKELKEKWGLSFEYREADLPEVKEVLAPDAKTKNVSPPFVSLYDSEGKFVDAIPFPTTDTAPIAEMIKRYE